MGVLGLLRSTVRLRFHKRGYLSHLVNGIQVSMLSLCPMQRTYLVMCIANFVFHNSHLILGNIRSRDGDIEPWSRTDPAVGNRWRKLAQGKRVYAFPIWLYCDDTSGNVSKKWNKHNSFLFTVAGLPRHLVHKEDNINFLSTSNIAPLLEILDRIVSQLR